MTPSWDEAQRLAEGSDREGDLALLRRLIDDVDLQDFKRDAFNDMLRSLGMPRSDEGRITLSEKQRAWARSVADRVGAYLSVGMGDAPRGREVPTPAVLQNLPKRPPGRR